MPVIPVLGKRRWEDSKFKAILGCMVSCYLKGTETKSPEKIPVQKCYSGCGAAISEGSSLQALGASGSPSSPRMSVRVRDH